MRLLSLSWYLLREGVCEELWQSYLSLSPSLSFANSLKTFIKTLFISNYPVANALNVPCFSAPLVCLMKAAWPGSWTHSPPMTYGPYPGPRGSSQMEESQQLKDKQPRLPLTYPY